MRYSKIPLATDAGLGSRARLGMLVLKTDQTLEFEAAQVVSRVKGVALHHARLYNDFTITRETLLAMKPLIPETAKLLPVEWGFKSIGFGCTSASMVIGGAEVERLVQTVHPDTPVTNPMTGGVAGLAALGCRRIAVLTPYTRPVNENVVAALQSHGLEISSFAAYEEPDDNVAGKISVAEIVRASVELASSPDVDGVFVSCTSLRTIDAIPAIEAQSGKPATSSNHGMIWHMLRQAGIDEPINGLGRLYQQGLNVERAAAAE